MLYIRTDMNNIIATGHVIRCLSIADAVKSLGEDTTFILADEQAVELISGRGYQYIVLHTKWDDMESEISALLNIISENNIKRMLIDSYQVTKNYLKKLQGYLEIYYMDDLNAFFYSVDAIISYEINWEKRFYLENYRNTRLYLGPQYTPLRKAFINCEKKEIKPKVEKLLLLSGGTDSYNFLESTLERIKRENYQQIVVICGHYYPDYEGFCKRYEAEKNVWIYKSVTDIEKYMIDADVAISAGGITLYELCACGTPTISYAIADNQFEAVHTFAKMEMIDYAGDIRKENVAVQIADYLDRYSSNQKLRQERSLRMQQLVDGKGALRIAKKLMNLEP